MKVLVTGGGGFIGLALVHRLKEEGYEPVSFSRRTYPVHEHIGIRSVCGDIADMDACRRACEGIDTVFHLAGEVGVWGSYAEFHRTNVTGTQNMIRSCLEQRVRSLIFTSSASVVFGGSDLEGIDESLPYPESPVSHYTSTKAEAERLVLGANGPWLKTISLRPHLVWGPGDTQLAPKIIARARSGKLRLPGKGDHFTDITYIDNLIDAQLLAMKKLVNGGEIGGKAFFITNGETVQIREFINGIIGTAGLPPVQKSIPEFAAILAAAILEALYNFAGIKREPFVTRMVVKELCTHHWFDISAAKKELGYHPRIQFREGMEKIRQSDDDRSRIGESG
jgi:nucleoside-diphosphate-sugar epimerase